MIAFDLFDGTESYQLDRLKVSLAPPTVGEITLF